MSTSSAYKSGQRRYLTFCSTFSLSPFPVSEYTLCRFVAFLARSSLSYASIRLYLSAVRHLQISIGLPDLSLQSNPRLDYVMRGIRRQLPQYTRPRRMPITPSILLALYQSWSAQPVSYTDMMLWAACCLAFFGFLRCGEFTCPSTSPITSAVLSLGDIAVDSRVNPQLLRVHLRHRKTDPFGNGITLSLGRTGHLLCPVSAVLSYLAVRSGVPGPLFILPNGSPLSRNMLITSIRETLALHGVDTTLYSGHSFRIGAATTAAAVGLGDALIKKLGRWKSSAYMSYIRLPTDCLAQASARLVDDATVSQ